MLFSMVFECFFWILAFSATGRSKTAQEAPNIAPRQPETPPRRPQDGPRGLKTAQDAPKTAQDAPKTAPRRDPDAGSPRTSRTLGSKRPPGGPKKPPGSPQDSPRDPQEAPRGPGRPPKGSQTTPNRHQNGPQEASEPRPRGPRETYHEIRTNCPDASMRSPRRFQSLPGRLQNDP